VHYAIADATPRRKAGLKLFGLLFLLLLAVAGFAAYVVYAPIGPPSGTSDDNATYVEIAPGTGTQAIAAQLESVGVIRSRYGFELLRTVKGGKLLAGEYRFNHPAPATEVYARIVRGDVYTRTLTIPEGYNIFDIAHAVESAGFAPADAFLAAERSQTALIADLEPNAPSLEGFLFPDTYRFPRRAAPQQMLAAMVRRFRQVAGQLGLGPDTAAQTVTLASLVEKEVSQDAERPLVAGVFVNRLAQRMPLATDPTVIYAALLRGRYRGTIYQSDLQFDSPYNTYRHAGLPPGPICSPGIAALKAALTPAHTGYLYFVADTDGHSQFSATLKEHAQQVESYRRAIRGQKH
jgi:UPF0755 protein